MTEPATSHLAIDLSAVDRQPGGQAFEDPDQRGTVRLTSVEGPEDHALTVPPYFRMEPPSQIVNRLSPKRKVAQVPLMSSRRRLSANVCPSRTS